MRAILILALVALAAEAQIRPGPRRNPPQRRQFLDPFQGPPRGGPPFRGPPPPPPPGFRGPPPPPPPPPAFRPQGGSPPRGRPDQVLSLGQLPLNPRPEFDNPSFFPPHEENFAGEEVQFDGADFDGPIFADDVEGLRPNREEFEESFEPTSFVEEDHEAPPTTVVSQGPPQIETSAPKTHAPRQQLEEPQQFEQETQEVVEFLSSPPPRRPQPSSIRTRSPRPQSRFPAHPNQLPLRNIIEEVAPLENRQRPARDPLVEYEYEDEEDDEEEEPDRLSILLQNSHFSCVSKKNGYYADEEVDCEVFHYCQENVKHSWLCPEGASFHQVHLICMPRSEDNICAKSSKFHFVNDFLYKEVDGENKTYADRYYPEGFEDGVAKLDDGGAAPVNNHPPPPPPPRNNIPTHFEPIEDSHPIPVPPRHQETFVDRLPQRQPEFLPPQFHSGENLPGRPFVDRRPGQFGRPRPRPNGPQLGFQG